LYFENANNSNSTTAGALINRANALGRHAIVSHIDDLEDLYVAAKRLLASRAGESETLEDVMKRYGLEG